MLPYIIVKSKLFLKNILFLFTKMIIDDILHVSLRAERQDVMNNRPDTAQIVLIVLTAMSLVISLLQLFLCALVA